MSSQPLESPQLADAQALLDRLLTEHKPGFALPREFQTDPGLYQLDLERIWRRGWLFAGHSCEVKRPGDYVVFDVDTDSIIVMRGDDGVIHALHNTCRRHGTLLTCGGMDADGDLDRRDFNLRGVHAREVGGLIFVCLADDPMPFDGAGHALGAHLTPQGLERARVAAVRSYEVRANWKLVWENNRECWHCEVGH